MQNKKCTRSKTWQHFNRGKINVCWEPRTSSNLRFKVQFTWLGNFPVRFWRLCPESMLSSKRQTIYQFTQILRRFYILSLFYLRARQMLHEHRVPVIIQTLEAIFRGWRGHVAKFSTYGRCHVADTCPVPRVQHRVRVLFTWHHCSQSDVTLRILWGHSPFDNE